MGDSKNVQVLSVRCLCIVLTKSVYVSFFVPCSPHCVWAICPTACLQHEGPPLHVTAPPQSDSLQARYKPLTLARHTCPPRLGKFGGIVSRGRRSTRRAVFITVDRVVIYNLLSNHYSDICRKAKPFTIDRWKSTKCVFFKLLTQPLNFLNFSNFSNPTYP